MLLPVSAGTLQAPLLHRRCAPVTSACGRSAAALTDTLTRRLARSATGAATEASRCPREAPCGNDTPMLFVKSSAV